jgi:predicted DNA-binding transcriptional regulator AlpA
MRNQPKLSPQLLAANEAHISEAGLAADRPRDQHDRLQVHGARGPPSDLVLFNELQQLLPLSRSTIWRLERAGHFPRRILISAKRVAWRRSAIEHWLEQRATQGAP